ncbi:MAG: response regulator [Calditrichia bacterium]
MQKVVMHIGQTESVKLMIKNAIRENDLVVSRPDAAGAAQWFRLGRMPHLIVCEMNLPGMSGHNLLGAVQRNKQLKGIPFVFFTSYMSPSDRQIIRSAGAVDCFRYSCEPQEFIDVCQDLLHLRQGFLEKNFQWGSKVVDKRAAPGTAVKVLRGVGLIAASPIILLRRFIGVFAVKPKKQASEPSKASRLATHYSDAA